MVNNAKNKRKILELLKLKLIMQSIGICAINNEHLINY